MRLASVSRFWPPAMRRRAIRDSGTALLADGRFDEADSVLARGLAVYPDDGDLLVAFAMSAHNAGRYDEATVRWTAALRVAGDQPMCHAGLAANRRELGDYDRAQAILDIALRRFPGNLAVMTEAARLAASRGRFRDALRHWQVAVATPKPHPDWLQGHAQALVILGAFDEASGALGAARAAYPDHMGLFGVEGLLASAREDWPKAVAHWTDYRARFPEDPTGWQQLGLAVQGSQLSQLADRLRPVLPVAVAVIEDDPLRRLMLRFESLGDNCEFGLVQRRYGAEPLSLLRWNNVAFGSLLAALAARFDGMGEPAHTEMAVAANGEYFVQDRRWHLGMHTFLYEGQTDRTMLYAQMCRRVVFLRDKLLGDLAAAGKIFVYRADHMDDARLASLRQALDAFGSVTLLSVQLAGSPSIRLGDPGTVEKVEDRLLVGVLGRSGVDRNGNWNIAFEDWVSVCRKAAEMA